MFKEMLSNLLCGMKRKAHGAQEPKHIQKYVEVTNTDISYPGTARHVSDVDSPAHRITQHFHRAMSAANRRLLAALCCYAVLLGMALYALLPAHTSEEQLILGAVLLIFAILTAKTLTHRES